MIYLMTSWIWLIVTGTILVKYPYAQESRQQHPVTLWSREDPKRPAPEVYWSICLVLLWSNSVKTETRKPRATANGECWTTALQCTFSCHSRERWAACALVGALWPVWDDILTAPPPYILTPGSIYRMIFWPRGQYIVTIFLPPLRNFDPLLMIYKTVFITNKTVKIKAL